MLCASSSAVTTECPQFSSQAEAAPPPAACAAPPAACSGRAFLSRAAGGLLASASRTFLSLEALRAVLAVFAPLPPPCSIHRNREAKSRNGRRLPDRHWRRERCPRVCGAVPGDAVSVGSQPCSPWEDLSAGGGRALKAASKKLSERFRPGGAPLNSAPRGGRLRAAPRLRLPSVRSFLGIHHTHFTFYVYMFG